MSEKQNTLINCICVLISFSTIYGMDPCAFRSYGNKLKFGALDVLYLNAQPIDLFIIIFCIRKKNESKTNDFLKT